MPVIIGGIEASLWRIAHYACWSDQVRKSVLLDSKADLLVYGNAERQVVEIALRLANGEAIGDIRGIRGTVHFVKQIPEDWVVKDSTDIDKPGALSPKQNPYQEGPASDKKPDNNDSEKVISFPCSSVGMYRQLIRDQRVQTVIRLPANEAVKDDPILYAYASRVMHAETNPGNARPLIQQHGQRQVWINPPPIPLSTKEMDGVFDLPYSRVHHKAYGNANVPAIEMIQHSVNSMRGYFGGCTFCSITEHEGRIIQSCSEDSIIREIEAISDTSPNFTAFIFPIWAAPQPTCTGWTAKMKRLKAACRKPSCVYPGICPDLNTDHSHLIKL